MESMDKIRDRQKIKKRLYSKTTRVILLIVLIFLIKPTWNVYKKNKESAENLARAERELSELEAKQKDLLLRVDDINTEAGKDREIREKFGVVKEGETAIVIVKNKEKSEETEEAKGFWAKFVDFFR